MIKNGRINQEFIIKNTSTIYYSNMESKSILCFTRLEFFKNKFVSSYSKKARIRWIKTILKFYIYILNSSNLFKEVALAVTMGSCLFLYEERWKSHEKHRGALNLVNVTCAYLTMCADHKLKIYKHELKERTRFLWSLF